MKQCGKQMLAKSVRLFGLLAILAVLFVISQILAGLHTHNLFFSHGEDEPAHQQVECSICLVVGIASDLGQDAGTTLLFSNQNGAVIATFDNIWNGPSVSPGQTRAPPHV